MTTSDFAALATAQSDDSAVLPALRERGIDEDRVRRWSEKFEQRFKAYIPLWDVDEGYVKPTAVQSFALAAFWYVEGPLMGSCARCAKRRKERTNA